MQHRSIVLLLFSNFDREFITTVVFREVMRLAPCRWRALFGQFFRQSILSASVMMRMAAQRQFVPDAARDSII